MDVCWGMDGWMDTWVNASMDGLLDGRSWMDDSFMDRCSMGRWMLEDGWVDK